MVLGRKNKFDKSCQFYCAPLILNSQHTHLQKTGEKVGNVELFH